MSPRWSDESTLDELRLRLESTDLVPSQRPLLEELAARLELLAAHGVADLGGLRAHLKTKTERAALAAATGIDEAWLNLLRRAVEGFFPRPRKLAEFDWLEEELLESLVRAGIKDTGKLLAADPAEAARTTGLTTSDLDELYTLADLCRIQWVAPRFARVLLAAGYGSPTAVAAADPATLHAAVVEANADSRFYRGKVGLRDIRRLVAVAAYLAD
jgi:hypothetical protein